MTSKEQNLRSTWRDRDASQSKRRIKRKRKRGENLKQAPESNDIYREGERWKLGFASCTLEVRNKNKPALSYQ